MVASGDGATCDALRAFGRDRHLTVMVERMEIRHLESAAYGAAHGVVEVLRGAGVRGVLCGWVCVRDLLLGVEPKDFDVATSARPGGGAAAVFGGRRRWGRILGWCWYLLRRGGAAVGAEGLGSEAGLSAAALPSVAITDAKPGRMAIEVATFRYDGAYTDGRRPDAVRFSESAFEDVRRRDFTINGMMFDVARFAETDDLDGSVLDYVGWSG